MTREIRALSGTCPAGTKLQNGMCVTDTSSPVGMWNAIPIQAKVVGAAAGVGYIGYKLGGKIGAVAGFICAIWVVLFWASEQFAKRPHKKPTPSPEPSV